MDPGHDDKGTTYPIPPIVRVFTVRLTPIVVHRNHVSEAASPKSLVALNISPKDDGGRSPIEWLARWNVSPKGDSLPISSVHNTHWGQLSRI